MNTPAWNDEMTTNRRGATGTLVSGLVVAGIGVVLLLDRFGIVDIVRDRLTVDDPARDEHLSRACAIFAEIGATYELATTRESMSAFHPG